MIDRDLYGDRTRIARCGSRLLTDPCRDRGSRPTRASPDPGDVSSGLEPEYIRLRYKQVVEESLDEAVDALLTQTEIFQAIGKALIPAWR